MSEVGWRSIGGGGGEGVRHSRIAELSCWGTGIVGTSVEMLNMPSSIRTGFSIMQPAGTGRLGRGLRAPGSQLPIRTGTGRHGTGKICRWMGMCEGLGYQDVEQSKSGQDDAEQVACYPVCSCLRDPCV